MNKHKAQTKARWNQDNPWMCILGVLTGLVLLFVLLFCANLGEHFLIESVAGEVNTGPFADQNYNLLLFVILAVMMVGYYLTGYVAARIAHNREMAAGLILSILAAGCIVTINFTLSDVVGEKPVWFIAALNILGTFFLVFGASKRKHKRLFH